MNDKRAAYPMEIAGVHRELPLFEIKPGLRIAILNILGDTEFVQAAARALAMARSISAVSLTAAMPITSLTSEGFTLGRPSLVTSQLPEIRFL